MKNITDLPPDTVVHIAQFLETFSERLHFRHSCSFVHAIAGSHSYCSLFFSVDSNYGESLLVMSLDTSAYIHFFEELPQRLIMIEQQTDTPQDNDNKDNMDNMDNDHENRQETKHTIEPFTHFMMCAMMKGSSRMMEQYGFAASRHITDCFFYCLMRCVLDVVGENDQSDASPQSAALLDTLLHVCRMNSSFWNSIDRLVGYVYPRLCFYQMFVRLARQRRLAPLVNMLADAGVNVPAIDFNVYVIGVDPVDDDDVLPPCYKCVPLFTTVHLVAWLKDYDTLEVMGRRFENSMEVEAATQLSTPLYYCLRDPELYDVAIYLMSKLNATVYSTFDTPDESEASNNPWAKQVRDILEEKDIVPAVSPPITTAPFRTTTPLLELAPVKTVNEHNEEKFDDLDAMESMDWECLQEDYACCTIEEAPRENQLVECDDDSYEERDEQGLDIRDLINDEIGEIEDLIQHFERVVEDEDCDDYYGDGYDEVWINSRKPFDLNEKETAGEQHAATLEGFQDGDEDDIRTSELQHSDEPVEVGESLEPKAKKRKKVHGVVSREELVMAKSSFRSILRHKIQDLRYKGGFHISPCASVAVQRAIELAVVNVFKLADEYNRKKQTEDAPLQPGNLQFVSNSLIPYQNSSLVKGTMRDIYRGEETMEDDSQDSDFDPEMYSDVSSDSCQDIPKWQYDYYDEDY